MFELARGAASVATLFAFDGSNGTNPLGGVVLDAAGNLYGTTSGGGLSRGGTIFELSPSTAAVLEPATSLMTMLGVGAVAVAAAARRRRRAGSRVPAVRGGSGRGAGETAAARLTVPGAGSQRRPPGRPHRPSRTRGTWSSGP